MKFSLSVLAALIAGVTASNVVELTPDNFDTTIGKGVPALVEFFAPWCGHCKNLAPIYEQVADAYAHAKDKVIVAKVDADGVGKPLGQKYGVTGFPTLKWFGADGEPEDYAGPRELDDFASYITRKTSVKSKIKPPPPSNTKILDASNFNDVALDKSKDVLVAFTAPWCGHCKNMKPIYEKVATTFLPESKCIVANLDADHEMNKGIAQKYGITGFPTIKFFGKGKDEPEDYAGGRSEDDFVEYLNEKCGTLRAVGGGLNDKAGRHEGLDDIASRFFVAASGARKAIYDEAVAAAANVGTAGKHYLRVMEKVVNSSEAYLEKETKRLASILEKRTLSAEKLDEIKIKVNVLNAFKKPAEVVETARDEAEL